jgi:integrase
MLVQQEENEVYLNFINSIKSDVTKKIYEYNLRLFMEFCGIDRFSGLIGHQDKIIPYLMSLREKKLSFNSISTRLNAIYHFYDMNDISLNKKKIKMFKGEHQRKVVDRAYRHDEIKKILDVSDLRAKTIVLLMASSGVRIGSLPSLRLRNLEKVSANNVYKITVYEGSNSQYYTFCSPECTSYIDAYLDFRTINGEKLNSDSYLIREQFDISDLEQIKIKSKGMTLSGIISLLNVILLKSGVRSASHNKGRREIARAHGFRKYAMNQMVNSRVSPESREMLLGHKIGLAGCYYRPTEQEMLTEYEKAINLLTINEENRLKFKLEKSIQIERSAIDQLKTQFEEFRNEMLKQRSKK